MPTMLNARNSRAAICQPLLVAELSGHYANHAQHTAICRTFLIKNSTSGHMPTLLDAQLSGQMPTMLIQRQYAKHSKWKTTRAAICQPCSQHRKRLYANYAHNIALCRQAKLKTTRAATYQLSSWQKQEVRSGLMPIILLTRPYADHS